MPGHVCSPSSEEDVDESEEDEEADGVVGDEVGHSEMLLPTTWSRSAVSKFMPCEEYKVTYDDVSQNSYVINCHSLRKPWAAKLEGIASL